MWSSCFTSIVYSIFIYIYLPTHTQLPIHLTQEFRWGGVRTPHDGAARVCYESWRGHAPRESSPASAAQLLLLRRAADDHFHWCHLGLYQRWVPQIRLLQMRVHTENSCFFFVVQFGLWRNFRCLCGTPTWWANGEWNELCQDFSSCPCDESRLQTFQGWPEPFSIDFQWLIYYTSRLFPETISFPQGFG